MKKYYIATSKNCCLYMLWKERVVPSWPWSYGSWIYNYLCNQCLSPLMLWVRISIRELCTTLCDKVCQWHSRGRWFFSDTSVSSTNKTDRHDITTILLFSTIKQTTNKQIMKKKFRQQNEQAPLNTKNATPSSLGNIYPGLGQAQKCDGVKPVNRIPPFLSYDVFYIDHKCLYWYLLKKLFL